MRSSLPAVAIAILLIGIPGGSLYYASGDGDSCASCHEIRQNTDTWHSSTHRSVACKGCHGGSSMNVSFHAGNLRRLLSHLRDDIPEKIRLRETDVEVMVERCRGCHRQEFAEWQAGPHSVTYREIFLDRTHNAKRLLIDDCLRCHGMFLEGSIGDLVSPLNTSGPWTLKQAGLSAKPAIPCLACHEMHREGSPMAKPPAKPENPGPGQKLVTASLTLWDRREGAHLPLAFMALPAVVEGQRAVTMSPDARQALCYQCHAPLASAQAGSGDDRTPLGVHEGLSCLACHLKHGQQTRASCAGCHPRLSNCGVDVERMDTTFVNTKSKHNVHTVKCADCHPKGVPLKKVAALIR